MRNAIGCILVGGLLFYSLLAIPAGLEDVNNVSGLHGIAIGLSIFWGLVLLVSLVYLVKFIIDLRTNRLKQVHLYIEGGGNNELVSEVIATLHPEFLQMSGLKISKHEVADWPSEPFVHAAVDLKMNHGITLTRTNCDIQDGSAYGKRLYFVMLK